MHTHPQAHSHKQTHPTHIYTDYINTYIKTTHTRTHIHKYTCTHTHTQTQSTTHTDTDVDTDRQADTQSTLR